jgi:Spy/CpxP family protein refolding chaperone
MGQQNRPQQQPDFGALKSFLNLTDSQIRQMQQAREKAGRDAVEKEKALRPQIGEKHNALADLMDKDNADPAAVGKAMLEIRGLERQIRAAHEAARTAELSVLTPEQKTKFKAIQDAANLPAATREAQRLGLVPGPPQGGPNAPRPRLQNGPAQQGPGQPMNPPPPGPRGGPENDR